MNLGYVRPTARNPVTQPALDRYASDLRDRLSRTVSVPIVPADELRDRVGAAVSLCTPLHRVGFVEPGRRWHVTASLVSADALLTIADCFGNMFYAGDVLRTAHRDKSVSPYVQVDAAGADAAVGLLRNFECFKRARASAWERMINTGSVRNTSASAAPSTSP